MTEAPSGGEVVFETHDPADALALAGPVCALYEAVFALHPFNGDAAEFADQRSHYREMTGRPGFQLTTARSGRELVGFGYGFPLPPDTRWWTGLAEPLDDAFTTETGIRTFALIDYGVLPACRGIGVGHGIHDELLARSKAERATLTVQPKAEQTRAIYQRWGWRKVSQKIMNPPIPAPIFDILVLERMPTTRR